MKKILYLMLLFFLAFETEAQIFKRLHIPDMNAQKHRSNSASWGDIDNDGDLDLFVTNGESSQPNEFYLNLGAGRFESVHNNITEKEVPSFSSSWGDYNNDGWLDLYVANCNYFDEKGEKNFLFENKGDGTFERITEGVVANDSDPSYACAWVDYDNDGWIDIYVANAYNTKNRLYKNDGAGSFIEILDDPIVENETHDIGFSWSDYDNDFDQDLIVVTGEWGGKYKMYSNNGDGTFTKVGNEPTYKGFTMGRGAIWGDYNNDSWMDLLLIDNQGGGIDRLFKNDGDKDFTEVTSPSFSPSLSQFSGNCGSMGDFNNDGFLDIILSYNIDLKSNFLINNGAGGFEKIANEWTSPGQGSAWSLTSVDVNLDGLLDIFQSNKWEQKKTNTGPDNLIFLNRSKSCVPFAHVSLRGVQSNYYGLGARVHVYAKNTEGISTFQKREMSCVSAGGYTTQSGNILHFGLGDAQEIDSIVVYWPSRMTTTYTNLPINSHFILYENQEIEYTSQEQKFNIIPVQDTDCADKISAITISGATNNVTWCRNGIEISDEDILPLQSMDFDSGLITVKDGPCGDIDSFLLDRQLVKMDMFPNPASQNVNFTFTETLLENEYSVTIFDAQGKVVLVDVLDQDIDRISVSNLAAGNYIIVVDSGCTEFVEKLVVVRGD